MAPASKRQKRAVILSSDEESEQEVVKPSAGRGRSINLTTRRQKGLTSAQADSSALPARSVPIPSPKRGKAHDQKRAKTVSLYSFFNKTTQSQTTDRTLDRNTPVSSEVEDVQDDDMESMQTTGVAVGSRATNGTGPLISKAGSNTSRNTGRSSARKFVSSKDTTRRSHSPASLGHRSWLEKHTPRHIDELAVHKKKIQDVRNWLENVFAGRDPRIMLVLKGPPGSGKTATIKLLAEAMECDVSEWTNPVGADYTSEGYLSWSAKFDDFMARSGRYPTLSMDNEMDESPARAASSALNQVGKKDRKIILIEEFPSLAGNPLASLSSFRTSILQHLAHAGAAAGSTDSHPDTPSVIPIVTIISEDHIGVSTSFCDSFTVMRILGPDIVHHARVAVIEFNPVAPTFLSKALGSAIQRENKQAGRNISVGLELLKKLSTSGDIRSAFGSLEFLSLGGQYCGEYSNSRPASVRSSKLTRKSGASSKIGAESLELDTQREAKLDIFHAVGKVLYNKRLEPGAEGHPVQNAGNLSDNARPLESEVSVEDLLDTIGTDIPTFVAALHENYLLSCASAETLDRVDGCIDALSDSDMLSSGHWSSADAYSGSTAIDSAKQSEMCFHNAVRGLLYSLPYPVKRQSIPSRARPYGKGREGYKMFYPVSVRLWKAKEETLSLLSKWMSVTSLQTSTTGNVQPFQSFENNNHARNELILERLPYVAKINTKRGLSSEVMRITQFSGKDISDDEGTMMSWFEHKQLGKKANNAFTTGSLDQQMREVEVSQERLVLSDDDIEDD